MTLPDGRRIEAEVVGFNGDVLYLMPVSSVQGLLPGAAVEPTGRSVRLCLVTRQRWMQPRVGVAYRWA